MLYFRKRSSEEDSTKVSNTWTAGGGGGIEEDGEGRVDEGFGEGDERLEDAG